MEEAGAVEAIIALGSRTGGSGGERPVTSFSSKKDKFTKTFSVHVYLA